MTYKMRHRAKGEWSVLLFVLLLLLTSCGDFWEFENQQVVTAEKMALGRKVVNLMVGDSCVIPVNFVPDSLSNYNVYWLAENDSVVRFKGDTLVATAEGQTRAIAFTTIDRLTDTCYVNVISPFREDNARYPYDMVIYAQVEIHGLQLTAQNSGRYEIGAFVGEEVRGLGAMRTNATAGPYMELRVWSPYAAGDRVTFRCYYRGTGLMEVFADTLTFDGGMHGTLSDLYPLVLDEQASEYQPIFNLDDGRNPYIENNDTIKIEIED